RAQKRLYLTVAGERTIWGRTLQLSPSRFLYDVPPDRLELIALKGHRSTALAAWVRKATVQGS
ncbi:MAG: hypothetical protein ACREOV_09695, partial [Candidatus Dormibacteraceae bacterium]